jgi:hypothetical protein
VMYHHPGAWNSPATTIPFPVLAFWVEWRNDPRRTTIPVLLLSTLRSPRVYWHSQAAFAGERRQSIYDVERDSVLEFEHVLLDDLMWGRSG